MRIGALILLLANLAIAAYFALVSSAQRSALDVRSLEINADQVKQLRDAPVPPNSAAAACLEWGPLAAAELARAREELTKLKIEKTSVRESPGTMVWWVHLPPSKSRDEAERRVRDIEELGVRDARVVNDEGWRNAVSLGSFREYCNAPTGYDLVINYAPGSLEGTRIIAGNDEIILNGSGQAVLSRATGPRVRERPIAAVPGEQGFDTDRFELTIVPS